AMQDITADETAIYGFRPSDTGSLKAYADADWSDPEVVEKGRQERIAYHQSIEGMYQLLEEMTAEGSSVEEIARAVSTKRNEIRLASYENDPEGLATLKARNLEKYGHEEGPLPDELFEQYGSWETVMAKAFSVNVGMDACLGLYDDYYNVYVALGQAVQEVTDDTATISVTESAMTAEQSEINTTPKTEGDNVIIYVIFLIALGAIAIVSRSLKNMKA
ncbi:MAG: hypothetical protein IJS94_00230, partial [Clostridia bacterium]|nr:hypothetical protein [Clostridia bacterium]